MTAASWQARGGATPNKGQRYPAEVLTAGEVTALLRQCSHRAPAGIRNRALLMLLYRSGLRVAEVLALRPADVNLTAHTVRVLHGKGDKATTRGFHPSAADALARWIDTRRGAGIRGRTLFCTLAGGPLHPQYVRNLLHRLAARAGISKRVHPHGLRHTFAWELERRGVASNATFRTRREAGAVRAAALPELRPGALAGAGHAADPGFLAPGCAR